MLQTSAKNNCFIYCLLKCDYQEIAIVNHIMLMAIFTVGSWYYMDVVLFSCRCVLYYSRLVGRKGWVYHLSWLREWLRNLEETWGRHYCSVKPAEFNSELHQKSWSTWHNRLNKRSIPLGTPFHQTNLYQSVIGRPSLKKLLHSLWNSKHHRGMQCMCNTPIMVIIIIVLCSII